MLLVENLSVNFQTIDGTKTVLDNVSFRLDSGKTLGLVGESGSGKSMTSLAVMGLLPQNAAITHGKILFGKDEASLTDISHYSQSEFQRFRGKKIAMIFQEPMTSLNPVQRCGDQVIEMIQAHESVSKKIAHARAVELFTEMRLPKPEAIAQAFPHEISGGQKQRIMIAMALAANPEIIIADEPTTALDVTVQAAIMEILREIQSKYGMSMIFISHDLALVGQIADEIAVMRHGKILEQNSTKVVFTNPQHPYTKALIECRPTIHQDIPHRLPTVNDRLIETSRDSKLRSVNESAESLKVSSSRQKISSEPLLHIDRLSVHFLKKKSFFSRSNDHIIRAVDEVSFSVFAGETLGLVGESGSGKTTIGRAILRLVEPSSGKIFLGGQDICQMNSDEMKSFRRQAQIIFQDPYSSLNPRKTVGSAILEVMTVHSLENTRTIRIQTIIEILEKVGLSADFFNRYPHELSGGQRQRIAIARALVLKPKLLICDESVSALDVSVQAQTLNLLADLRDEFGLTYIFITHDLGVVRFLCDTVAVMQAGKIIEVSNTKKIFQSPKEKYTQRLIEAVPIVKIEQ